MKKIKLPRKLKKEFIKKHGFAQYRYHNILVNVLQEAGCNPTKEERNFKTVFNINR
jgi:hypothetical protein